ncbi:SLC13 family permease [Butyrivibrio proteoclasticus]|uniref:SLC13 family permease n=1 Tax=Butyrivibrio proteoclasticus TaxID=43305 RepID=UPI0004795012|nr:SLC13 family permease [Butyrivibrio proteoclasticus]
MKQFFSKIKSDPVLIAAWILAIISAFVVTPDKEYIGYIDFRSLGILWSLMIVIQGLKENSVFEKIATGLLEKVNTGRSLAIILILMCFLGSMFITNDVALITFVPFALMLLHSCKRDDLAIPVVVLQTVAANLGSMLTPIGNPQNLYLFSATGMGIVEFILCMLPYTLITLALLFVSAFLLKNGSNKIEMSGDVLTVGKFGSNKQIIIYMVLFVLAILSVVRVIPWYVAAICVFVVVLGMDYKILFRADYMLLLTFIGFFVFTGNIGRIPQIHDYLKGIVSGREFYSAIVASQFISNVPATFLLFEFAEDYKELLRGVNIGGLGTLIASMASLISYKNFANAFPDKKGKYILKFSLVNVIYLVIMLLLHIVLV